MAEKHKRDAQQAQLEAATASEQLKGALDKAGRAEEREAKQVQSAKDDAAQVIDSHPLRAVPRRTPSYPAAYARREHTRTRARPDQATLHATGHRLQATCYRP